MPEIRSFRGIVYNPNLVEISKVVAPPYDVISPEDKKYYQSLSKHNIVDLLLEEAREDDDKIENKYTRTAQRFKQWLNCKILIKDEVPGFYVYSQEYQHDGKTRRRLGFIGLVRIVDEEGEILPHENTFEKTKLDRYRLLKEVKANLSPIFSVFDDPQMRVNNLLDDFTKNNTHRFIVSENEVIHKIWSVTDKSLIKEISEYLRDKPSFIADGHHRFESAMLYREFMRSKVDKFTENESFNFVMSYFVSWTDKGLSILPTHRIVKEIDYEDICRRISENFLVQKVSNYDELYSKMQTGFMNNSLTLIGAYDGEHFSLLRLKEGKQINEDISENLKELDVTVLHSLLIPKKADVEFTRDENELISSVKNNANCFGFFLNPVRVEQIKRVALSGERMPQKSTHFYPKLLSGLVINPLDS